MQTLREFEDTHVILDPDSPDFKSQRELAVFTENLRECSKHVLRASAMLTISKHRPQTLKVNDATERAYMELARVWGVLNTDLQQLIKIHDECALDYATNIATASRLDTEKEE